MDTTGKETTEEKRIARLRAQLAFCVIVEEICVSFVRVCACMYTYTCIMQAIRESSRAHAAAPAYIRIVIATFPVVCRARRDLAVCCT